MATEDMWVTVHPGHAFPENQHCIRAFGIPRFGGEQCFCDPYIALWIRDGGEVVFGCAWNEHGKVRARFTWDGKMFTSEQTNGFRILKCCGHDSDKYHWVQAKAADESALLYSGEYTPAMIVNGDHSTVGKASWKRKMVWVCEDGKEESCQGDKFQDCYLLAEKRHTNHAGFASEDMWVTVRHGETFPQDQHCIRAFGIPKLGEQGLCDPYIALWVRGDGEAVFGCAWNEHGNVKARFTWDGKMFTGEQTDGFRILKCCDRDSDKYHWVQAKAANESTLLYSGEYTPAMIVNGDHSTVGKASWKRKVVWVCEDGKEESCRGDKFQDCYLLAKK
uniref:Uncharacterized protein n=1 Tax=Plectus sambesii TaxID=2011161 RepID=A0A914W0A2_9BILA